MNLNEVYKTLTDHEKLTLLAAFGLPPGRVWIRKSDNASRETMNHDDIAKGGVQPLMSLLKKKLIRNLGLPNDPFRFTLDPNKENNFITTMEGNLLVLAILQSEYGYDTQPDWLE